MDLIIISSEELGSAAMVQEPSAVPCIQDVHFMVVETAAHVVLVRREGKPHSRKS